MEHQTTDVGVGRQLLARTGAGLFLAGGAGTVLSAALFRGDPNSLAPLVVVGLLATVAGGVLWFLPWERWSPRATLTFPPLAFALIAAANIATGTDSDRYAVLFVACFAWIGVSQPRGAALAFSPLFAAAYLAPVVVLGQVSVGALASFVLIAPISVVIGETIAWQSSRARAMNDRLGAERARELFSSLVQGQSDPTLVLDGLDVITYVSPAVTAMLGYEVSELVGGTLDHVVSKGEALAILDTLRSEGPGANARVECLLRHSDGRWLTMEVLGTPVRTDRGGDLVLRLHDITRWKALEEQLTRQAFHDPLTALANRALFIDRLEHALGRRRHRGTGTAVMFLDLDDFKTVNDSLGHAEGDALIVSVAARLTETLRAGDTAARFGGDEFAVLLEDVDEDQAIGVATRILSALDRPFDLGERSLRVTASIGIAMSTSDLSTTGDLLRAADIAMYNAKDGGKGRYRVFEHSMHEAAAEKLRLGGDLRGALEDGEFVVHYQPIVRLPGGEIVGMEALVRWEHPERGLILPGEFIPLAEASGLIVQLGEHVLREACRQARSWQLARQGMAPLTVSVNLSGLQLEHPGLVAMVSLALEDTGLPPELLTLEITESVMAHESGETIRRLRQLKGLGVSLAIDDFGTGYSSLSYLRRFPIDIVKIDKVFIDEVARGADARALARAIINLAHSMKVRTIAEGVEDEEQVRRLARIGADEGQGYYFARPLDAKAATALVVGYTTITLWVGHSGRELDVIRGVVDDFEDRNPGLRVEVVGPVSDERIGTALAGHSPPDVVSSFESSSFGRYAAEGLLLDLEPIMRADGVTPDVFLDATRNYCRANGQQWAVPMLSDAYGLYCNLALFEEAGITRPPRTVQELAEYARRLTKRNVDGSLRVVGFDPMFEFYENSAEVFGQMFGTRWADETGRSTFARDPAWRDLFRWQKELVDWYGYENLVRFQEQVGEEFSPSNAFQRGRVAVCIDGEWRVASIAQEAPALRYGTAPLPVDGDAAAELYGSGFIGGSVLGIPARCARVREAWRLIRYLATDEDALAKLSTGLWNLPSTKEARRPADLLANDRFALFLDLLAHPASNSTPLVRAATGLFDALGAFVADWQAGRVADLDAALVALDERIDALARDSVQRKRLSVLPAA